MDIAVIGSNMVDLITYTNQMPKEGETLEAPAFKIGCGGKGRTRPWRPLSSIQSIDVDQSGRRYFCRQHHS